MKLKIFTIKVLIFMLILLTSYIENLRIKGREKNKIQITTERVNKKDVNKFKSYFGHFFTGFSLELCGKINIDICYPESWKGDAPKEKDTKAIKDVAETQTYWNNIKSYLKPGVEYVCKAKKLKNSVTKYITSSLKYIGWNRRRLFIQNYKNPVNPVNPVNNHEHNQEHNPASPTNQENWGWSGWIYDKSSTLTESAKNLLSGSVSMGNTAYEATKTKVTETLTETFKPVIDIYEQHIKESLHEFLTSPMMIKVQQILECVRNSSNILWSLDKNRRIPIENIITNTSRLIIGEPIFWVQVLVNLICKIKAFETIIDLIYTSSIQKGKKRWRTVGKFMGKFFLTIGSFKLFGKLPKTVNK